MTYEKDGAYLVVQILKQYLVEQINMDKFIVDSYQFASDVVEGVHIVDGE
jgi:hypothetical protein